MDEKILSLIKKQVKTEVFDVLNPKSYYYRLCIFDKVSCDDFKILKHPVPNLITALIAIDAISLVTEHRKINDLYFIVQYREGLDEEWKDWEDEFGNTITAYEIDENFNIYLPTDYEW